MHSHVSLVSLSILHSCIDTSLISRHLLHMQLLIIKKKKTNMESYLGTMLGCYHKHLLFCMHGGSSILITEPLMW